MIDAIHELPIDFSEKRLEPRRVPQASGELGNRWNRLFHLTNSAQPKEVSQEEMLGLVETARDYLQELKDDPKLFPPYWKKNEADGEIEWLGRAAECLRTGEGDMCSIDHAGKFISKKFHQQFGKNLDKDLKKRLDEVLAWLIFFKSSPHPLPVGQNVEHGFPDCNTQD